MTLAPPLVLPELSRFLPETLHPHSLAAACKAQKFLEGLGSESLGQPHLYLQAEWARMTVGTAGTLIWGLSPGEKGPSESHQGENPVCHWSTPTSGCPGPRCCCLGAPRNAHPLHPLLKTHHTLCCLQAWSTVPVAPSWLCSSTKGGCPPRWTLQETWSYRVSAWPFGDSTVSCAGHHPWESCW